MLSLKQLKDVCLAFSNNSTTCRYCGVDEDDPNKYFCVKKTKDKSQIDIELEEVVTQMKANGEDPHAKSHPLGDNCPGYPILKNILQGYDH